MEIVAIKSDNKQKKPLKSTLCLRLFVAFFNMTEKAGKS
jgi:hypothetical protein